MPQLHQLWQSLLCFCRQRINSIMHLQLLAYEPVTNGVSSKLKNKVLSHHKKHPAYLEILEKKSITGTTGAWPYLTPS